MSEKLQILHGLDVEGHHMRQNGSQNVGAQMIVDSNAGYWINGILSFCLYSLLFRVGKHRVC